MTDHVAISDIEFGTPGRGVYAFRKGDRVPADLVTQHGWSDFVASPTSKAGQQALADASGEAAPAATSTSTKGGNA